MKVYENTVEADALQASAAEGTHNEFATSSTVLLVGFISM